MLSVKYSNYLSLNLKYSNSFYSIFCPNIFYNTLSYIIRYLEIPQGSNNVHSMV